MARGAGTVVIPIVGDASKLKKALGDADRDLGGFSGKVENIGRSLANFGTKMTMGVTLPIIGGLALATKAAAEDEAAQASLAKTLQNTVGATDAVVASVEKQIAGMMKVSTFSDDDLRPAFAALVSETRNVTEANGLMTTAMDLAAAKNISVEEAANLLIKAHNGQTRGLAVLGVETKNAEGKAASFGDVMADVNKVVGGQAAEALGTSAGQTQALKRDMGELTEELGAALLPILEEIIPFIRDVTQKFVDMDGDTKKLIVTIGLFAAAIGPTSTLAANMIWLAANPVFLVLAALAAVSLAIIAAKNEWVTFPDPIIQALNALMGWFRWSFVEPLLLQFDMLISGASAAFGWIPGIGDDIREANTKFDNMAAAIRSALDPIPLAAERARLSFVAMKDEAQRVENAIRGMVYAGAIGGVTMVPIGGVAPAQYRFHSGGVVPGVPGTEVMAMLQAGETVLPLGARVGSTSAAGTTVNHYEISVTAIDPAAAQEAVITAIKEYERRNGTGWRVA